MRTCSVEGCSRRHDAKGLCSMHRSRMKKHGTVLGAPPSWDPKEDDLIRKMIGRAPAREIANQLGRPLDATKHRIYKLGLRLGKENSGGWGYSPRSVGNRTLVAKTCKRCGILRDASEFGRDVSQNGTWKPQCIHCNATERSKRPKPDGGLQDKRTHQSAVIHLMRQRDSEILADRKGFPYLEADLKVLSNPNLYLWEKAKSTGRTVSGVRYACKKFGFVSKGGKVSSRDFPKWEIENPTSKATSCN